MAHTTLAKVELRGTNVSVLSPTHNMDLHIKDVLRDYIKKDKKVGDAYYSQKISDFWKNHLGGSIVSRTTDIRFVNGKLIIKVDSAPLRHELFNNRRKLMDRINVFLDADVVHVIELS